METHWRPKILGAVAFVALLIIAFVIGMLIHGFEPNEVKAAQTKNATTAAAPGPRTNVTLVPVTASDAPQSIEQPITSAPPQAPGQQPNDATALPADEYAAAAARARAMREAEKAKSTMVDPRSLTGPAYEPSERLKPAARRTEPVAEYRPLPDLRLDHDFTAQLNLAVGADGRVTGIDVNRDQSLPEMQKLVAALQNWRFKPATENGTPVASRYSVEITFRGNE